jgi:hypothetical protein
MQLCLPGGLLGPGILCSSCPEAARALPLSLFPGVVAAPFLPFPLCPGPSGGLCLLCLPRAAGSAFSACPETASVRDYFALGRRFLDG